MSDFSVEPTYVVEDDPYRVEYRENGDAIDATVFRGEEILGDYPRFLESQQRTFELNAEFWINEAREQAEEREAAQHDTPQQQEAAQAALSAARARDALDLLEQSEGVPEETVQAVKDALSEELDSEKRVFGVGVEFQVDQSRTQAGGQEADQPDASQQLSGKGDLA